jgi:dTDP-glucose pyrophosphorylase
MDVKALCIEQTESVFTALHKLDKTGYGAVFVVDSNMKMLGILSDGDIRRGLLAGSALKDPVTKVMNTKFFSCSAEESRETQLQLLRSKRLRQLPILNSAGQIVEVRVMEEEYFRTISNPVVLMVGGLGTRLLPLTRQVPKPMIKVGDRPILEQTMERLINSGFNRFYFAVNYKSEVIENHFGDGSQWNVNIDYLREPERLGTAGALSLLPQTDEPFLVMNGDIVTDLDFGKFLQFHVAEGAAATVSVNQQQMQVQYGVVEFEGTTVKRIIEKPFHVFFISAGIYALNPECLEKIPQKQYLDMPSLLSQMIDQGQKVSAYSIHGYWKDIGAIQDLEQARRDFKKSS